MLVTRFVIRAGQIAERRSIETGNLDPSLLATARSALQELHAGAQVAEAVLCDSVPLSVRLGFEENPQAQNRLREQWHNRYPTAPVADYERLWEDVRQYVRRTTFAVGYGTRHLQVHLVREDCPLDDAGVYGSIAGSSIAGRCALPARQRSPLPRDEAVAEHRRVAEEVIRHKPAFLVYGDHPDNAAEFADCFAVTMLLDERFAGARAGEDTGA